ncbi:MAG TPA: type II toxin-antitoxin system RelE/ParE family toxin [Thermoanaerobaculia bacterium]|nr:type II toxin-antitoxin system RelE/ParE family toxin [Thermoanaerobaculia bacterium]
MNEYSLRFTRSASRELHQLEALLLRRIFPRIEALAREPRPEGCRKLHGEKNLWRIRIGDYRVIYDIDDRERTIDVTAVRHRRDAYR